MQLRLPYNKEATSSDDKRGLDSDLIFPVGAKKIKSGKGDVNVEEANSDDAIKMTQLCINNLRINIKKFQKKINGRKNC
ncbi:21266_t:CDS:2 [Gigaspora rosea]|nr:21266_t:CDS:2 [Gigaspora rosea]